MRVLYFARAREIAGVKAEELDLLDVVAADRPAPTVAGLLAMLSDRHGQEFEALAGRSTIMVDDEVVPRDRLASTPIGSEIAILPPVSGGDGPHEPGHGGHDTSGPPRSLAVAVLTISDRASAGTYEDRTGPALVEVLTDHGGFGVVESRIIGDSRDLIASTVIEWCDRAGPGGRPVDLVVTNGGTGLSDRDVTPEALRSVLDVEAPGLGEVMRSAGLASTPLAALSRQMGGRRGRTVVVAVPGSVRAATQSLGAVVGILPHLCALAAERPSPQVTP